MFSNYRKAAEMMNGSLEMVGLLVAVINNGLTGWINPGFIYNTLFLLKWL